MNAHDCKKKISDDHEVEEKIFRAGVDLYTSCSAYDVITDATLGESLGATEEFGAFVRALIKAGEGKNFIAREKALRRLAGKL